MDMKITFIVNFILLLVLSGYAADPNETECAGTQEKLIKFSDESYNQNQFVSWHFTSATPDANEVDLAVRLNDGSFRVQSDQFKGRLSLPRSGSTTLSLKNLVKEDSGTYRAAITGDGVRTQLEVQDPCLRSDMNENPATLTCLTTPESSAKPIVWKDNGEVIQGETGTTLSNVCNGKEDGQRTITCEVQDQRKAQVNITCSSAMTTTSGFEQEASDEHGLPVGAIVGIVVGVVVVLAIIVVVVIVIIKRRKSGGMSASDGASEPMRKEEEVALKNKE